MCACVREGKIQMLTSLLIFLHLSITFYSITGGNNNNYNYNNNNNDNSNNNNSINFVVILTSAAWLTNFNLGG